MSERLAGRTLHRLQDRLLRLLGSHREDRERIVQGMLRRDADEAVSYWLQLVVSVGIATLGLVVGSTAVVIGAMLVAPLMGPIVGLAMGLSTGSPFLVLRSGGRVLLSVAVAVGGAAAITLMLPFHEFNAELAARTTPTVLDLVTAGFCALAGVYASLRPGSDTASTAAGTSIGISLVPPLCASGYGLGTLAWPVAGGAALLFLTNLVAIVAVGCASFVASGFNRVDLATLERDELAKGQDAPIARLLARRLSHLFQSKMGPVLRFSMPLLLLAAVYVPLRRALDEVVWEVTVRRAVRDALAGERVRIVQSKAQVARHAVDVVVVLLGTASDAETTRARLATQIERVAHVKPSIEVLAVPDATAFAGLESTLLTPRPTPSAVPPPPLVEQLEKSSERAKVALLEVWPGDTLGEVLAVAIEPTPPDLLRLNVVHLGAPLPRAAQEGLERALRGTLQGQVNVVDLPLAEQAITRTDSDLAFMGRVAAAAQVSRLASTTTLCLTRPDAVDDNVRLPRRDLELARELDALLHDQPRLVTLPGGDFSVRIVQGACQPPPGPSAATPVAPLH
ncbi:MAG: DUF389 domain-containing protein [Myxococcales bacterium]